jgi:hypothetical protein
MLPPLWLALVAPLLASRGQLLPLHLQLFQPLLHALHVPLVRLQRQGDRHDTSTLSLCQAAESATITAACTDALEQQLPHSRAQ